MLTLLVRWEFINAHLLGRSLLETELSGVANQGEGGPVDRVGIFLNGS